VLRRPPGPAAAASTGPAPLVRFRGGWHEDVQQGEGEAQYGDGSSYSGGWQGGEWHGQGEARGPPDDGGGAGVWHKGGYARGVRHGPGGWRPGGRREGAVSGGKASV
jgi:hypothetical protein